MIAEFNKNWEEDYKIKSAAVLQSVIDKRDTAHRKNAKTVCDRNTAADIEEAGAHADDDDGGPV
jgi:hypothetical protein